MIAAEFHFMGRIMEVDLSKELHLTLFRKGTGNVIINFPLYFMPGLKPGIAPLSIHRNCSVNM